MAEKKMFTSKQGRSNVICGGIIETWNEKSIAAKWDGSIVERMYADNNAEAFECECSVAMKRVLDTAKLGNPSSPHTEGAAAKRILEWARRSMCLQTGVTDRRMEAGYGLVFTSGATESNRLGILGGLERANRWKSSRRMKLITTPLEHSSIVSLSKYLAEGDGDPDTDSAAVAVDGDGCVVEGKLADMASDPDVGVVAIILAHNELGRVQDHRSIARAMGVARRNREPYLISHQGEGGVQFPLLHYDAAQLLGRREVDFPGLMADTMSWSAHKFHGPNGIGGLFVRTPDVIDPHPGCCQTSRSSRGFGVGEVPSFVGHEMGLRSGTENVCGAACAAAALSSARHVGSRLERWTETAERGERMAMAAERIFGGRVIVNCRPRSGHDALCNTIHMSFIDGTKGIDVVEMLDKRFGISVSTGSACLMSAPSRALRAIGLSDVAILGSIRISLSIYDARGTVERMEDAFTALSLSSPKRV
jgi:cysteine desulfurase